MPLTPEEIQALDSHFGVRAAPSGVGASPVGQIESFKTGLDVSAAGRKAADAERLKLDTNRPQAESALQNIAQQAAKQIGLADRVGTDVFGVNGKGRDAVGKFDAWSPTFFPDTVDTVADIDNLNSSNFIAALNGLKAASQNGSSGLGQLSNLEGEKIQKANFNFDRAQSEKRFGRTTQDYSRQIRDSLNTTVKAFNDTYGTKYTADDLMKQYSPHPEEVKMQIRQKYGLDK